MPRLLITLILMLASVSAAAAQQTDAEGAKDHPLFSRLAGYYITTYDEQDFAKSEFDVGTDERKEVEGRYWEIRYELLDGARKVGPLQIARNYTNLIVQRGGTRLMEQVDPSGGTSVARLPVEGKFIWINVEINNSGEMYSVTVVEEAAMEQKIEFTAMELAKTLADRGTVALHDILFDTGKATLRPESAASLRVVGDVLKADATLRLQIQGHTDNVGAAPANLRLSEERAASVKAYLVEQLGIDAGRLTTAGLGDTRPVASNATDEGRAQNRRVELVKQ